MLWSERQWERIDLREKINLSLFYPIKPMPDRKSLWDVLVDGIVTENTITEIFIDDKFELPLTVEEVRNKIETYDTILDPDDPFGPPLAIDTLLGIDSGPNTLLFWVLAIRSQIGLS